MPFDLYPQVFVDELTCIGCQNCTAVCPATYMMEPDFGRARVMAQKVDNDESLQESIDCCPVDCIHWVRLFTTISEAVLCPPVMHTQMLICQMLLP